MDQEVKRRWVEALRSGEYRQGAGRLGSRVGEEKPKYCCLGVLCEVAKDRLGDIPMYWADRDFSVGSVLHVDYEGSYPSLRVAKALGLSGAWGEFPEGTPYGLDESDDHLARLNDDGFTFSQIADLIEWAF